MTRSLNTFATQTQISESKHLYLHSLTQNKNTLTEQPMTFTFNFDL